jgi:3-oxoacyl-(acyl-carrier-protein) synthase
MLHTSERRVVVTGMGVVAANGIGKEAFWQASSEGTSGIKRISRFPTVDLPIKVGGEISDFKALDFVERKLANRTDRMTHFAFAAVQEALQDAHVAIADEDPRRIGTVIANTIGGEEYVLEQINNFYTRGPRTVSAYTAIAWLQVANVGQTSIRYGLQGYAKTPVNDTVGGLDAISIAYGAIARGAADIILAGGCEACLHPFSLAVMGHHSEYIYCATGDDVNAYRPFDRRASGFIMAEGAAICILEEYEHARRRGAPIYGEVVGYGQTNDANGPTPPSSNGTQYARAIQLAMREGHLSTTDIAYVSLDGRASPLADQGEVDAMRRVFGADMPAIPASVPRTMQGHSFAASGAIDSVTALLALQHNLIPPTINCGELVPDYGLNLVRDEARPLSSPAVILGGRGIGGMNVALALRKI